MNDPALQWLTERASPAGTLGCALRRPDGQFIRPSADQICPASIIENILAKFDTLASIAGEPTCPQWSTWVFESGQIRLVDRPDGWRLAVVIRNESDGMPALDPVSREFLTVELGT